jgi:predicted amidohydrolase
VHGLLLHLYGMPPCARAQLVVCDSPVGRLGVTVCYDLRFPAVYQELVFERGAEVLLVPSAFTVKTGARVRTALGVHC